MTIMNKWWLTPHVGPERPAAQAVQLYPLVEASGVHVPPTPQRLAVTVHADTYKTNS